jgi:hypothetical protein
MQHSIQPLGALSLEAQGREVMAKLVHDVVAEAMRLDLYGPGPLARVDKVNGEHFGRAKTKARHG